MIATLAGRLRRKLEDRVILECGGLGYEVFLPPIALFKNRVAARLDSGALRADSVLTGVAAVLAGISLLGISAANGLGWWWADAVAALIVAVVILREGGSSFAMSRGARGRAAEK